jgi:hypothetical protein
MNEAIEEDLRQAKGGASRKNKGKPSEKQRKKD